MAKIKPIAIVYSDHHLNIWNNNNQGNRRLTDGLQILKDIKLKAKTLGVPTLFAGDLLHKEKAISNELLDLLTPTFQKVWGSELNPTYAISGNHDQCQENTLEHQSPSYIRTFSRLFKGLYCIDNYSVIPSMARKLVIHGVPYLTHNLGLEKAIKERVKEIKKGYINILLLHTTLPGAQDTDGREMDSNIKASTLKLLKQFDVVFVGHIHKPMKLGDNIYQVGAPNHQRKTDRDNNLGYCILYSDLTVEYVHLSNYPKFIELEYGKTAPDNKNFYYNKEKTQVVQNNDANNNFSDTTNHTKLAKEYIKEKGITDKKKKRALIDILNKHD